MTAFALRLCCHDPAREAPDYGGERATFVIEAATLPEALRRWLARAGERGVTLHVVEEARAVPAGQLTDLVTAAGKGGVAVGQAYAYPPLDPAQGVVFGLAEQGDSVVEVGIKAADTGAALTQLLDQMGEDGADLTGIEGLCDLAQADEGATFDGTPLKLAALGLSLSGAGSVQFGARYAVEEV